MKEKNQNTCHSRVFLSGISTLFPLPLRQRVAVGRVRGFTLVELLIAVIIIGVLVTVAVPQYQKAVLKSRFSSLMPLGKALHDGNESYYLEHGQYTNDPTKLDVRANNSNAQITLGNEDQHKYVLLTREDINNNLRMYQQKSPNFPGETHCEALVDNAQANWLCQDALKGTFVGTRRGYNVYSLDENSNGVLARIHYNASSSASYNGDVCIGNTGWFYCVGNFTNDAVCIGSGAGACQRSQYNHSVCVARDGGGSGTCHGTFSNHSICYCEESPKRIVCGCNDSSYDPTSCCEGSFCTKDRCADKEIVPPSISNYLQFVQ